MIKFSKNDLTKKEIKRVGKVIESGWLTHGKYNHLFEEEFKRFTDAKYSSAVSNCTNALHLACVGCGFKRDDEVLVPAMTHVATIHAIEFVGAKPVIVDTNKLSGNISIKDIKKKITKKTKGLIIVHMAGIPCEMAAILKIVKEKKLKLIEDCAHALGTYYNKKHVGNFGEYGCFSFYPTKQITTGEGGMLITNKNSNFKKINKLKAFGIDTPINKRKLPGLYDVKSLGFNYRLTDFQAAMGYFLLKKYPRNLKLRRKNAKEYVNSLNNKIIFAPFSKNNSYFTFQIFLESKKSRDEVAKKLKEKNIGFSIHYSKPLSEYTYYKKKYIFKNNPTPNARVYANTNLSLPVYPSLLKTEIKKICNILNKI